MSYNKGSQAVTAKAHAMHGRKLTQQDYRELIRKQTVSEVASYLKQQTAYSSLLRDINENLIHRGQLEEILKRDLFDQYMKIFHYLDDDEVEFYRFLIMKMEINEVLSCLRLLNAGRQEDYFLTLPAFFAKHSSFDLYALAKVKNFADLLNLLKSTPYYEILAKYDPSDGGKIDVIKIEFEFNKLYYGTILDIIERRFTGKVKSELLNSFGMQIDLSNITGILRLKKYFNAESSYIDSLLLPYYTNVSHSELVNIMNAPDAEAAWRAACKTFYGASFKKYNFEYVENYAQQIMFDYHKRLFMFTNSAPVAVVSFLQLKETEINNIIHIIEGIRYSLPPAQISKLLVGVES